MSDWINIAPLDAIPQRGARIVNTGHGVIGVFRTATDEVFAIDNACPHKSGPLSDGIVHGHLVTCPICNWVVSLDTGEVQGADTGQVNTYPIKVETGRIFLDTSSLKTRASAKTPEAAPA